MKLNKVTITGINSGPANQLFKISQKYPFVEFGILITKSFSHKRFAGSMWIAETIEAYPGNFSLHLCGKYVRDICKGEPSFLESIHSHSMHGFSRIQINLSCYLHLIDKPRLIRTLSMSEFKNKQFILQFSEPDFELISELRQANIDAVPFFDCSGGRGKLPTEWPKSPPDLYCGYAGGLTPENVNDELKKIAVAAGSNSIWIDVETGIRSSTNNIDWAKIILFLESCKSWIDPDILSMPKVKCGACGWQGILFNQNKQEIKNASVATYGRELDAEGFCPDCGEIILKNHTEVLFPI